MFKLNHKNPVVDKVILAITLGFISVVGLLSLPLTTNFVQDTKIYSILLYALVLLAAYAFVSYKKKALSLVISPLIWPILAFLVATLASTFIAPAYPVENLLGMGGVYLAFALIVLIGSQILPKSSEVAIVKTIAIVSLINIVTGGLQLVGFGPAQLLNHFFSLGLPTDLSFSLIGSNLISLEVASMALIGLVWQAIKSKKVSLFTATVVPILLIGVGLFAWSARPAASSAVKLPSYLASWSIALDTIRAPRTALIGSGPESFANSYRQYKPSWVNGTEDWALVFNSGSDLPLTLLATMGFLGLGSWLWLALRTIKLSTRSAKQSDGSVLAAPLIFSFLLNLVLPSNAILTFLQAILLASLIAKDKDQLKSLEIGNLNLNISSPKELADAFGNRVRTKGTNVPVYFSSLLVLAVSLFGSYSLYRAYHSQVLLRQATLDMQNNEVVKGYQAQQQAVATNPYLDSNRRSYALTNILIASALANKTDVTDEEKEQINLLLQQAVREATAATTLDPSDTQNWQVLASVYSNMIGLVEDADQWATQAYVTAVQTYPTDPNILITFGGVLLATNQTDQAISIFTQATNIKPDFANANYNLAVALRQADRLEEAKAAYQKTLALVDSSSEDFIKVTQEVEALDKEIEALPKDEEETAADQAAQNQGNSITDQQINTNQNEAIAPPQPDQEVILPETTEPTAEPTVEPTN